MFREISLIALIAFAVYWTDTAWPMFGLILLYDFDVKFKD